MHHHLHLKYIYIVQGSSLKLVNVLWVRFFHLFTASNQMLFEIKTLWKNMSQVLHRKALNTRWCCWCSKCDCFNVKSSPSVISLNASTSRFINEFSVEEVNIISKKFELKKLFNFWSFVNVNTSKSCGISLFAIEEEKLLKNLKSLPTHRCHANVMQVLETSRCYLCWVVSYFSPN